MDADLRLSFRVQPEAGELEMIEGRVRQLMAYASTPEARELLRTAKVDSSCSPAQMEEIEAGPLSALFHLLSSKSMNELERCDPSLYELPWEGWVDPVEWRLSHV